MNHAALFIVAGPFFHPVRIIATGSIALWDDRKGANFTPMGVYPASGQAGPYGEQCDGVACVAAV